MIPLTVGEIVAACDGSLAGVEPAVVVTSVATDSRAVGPGTMFVAIRGQRVDGHDFAEEAVQAGAAAVLASRALHARDGAPLPCVVVDDPVAALGRLASWVRRERLACTVIGVTGSSGKTTTKDLMAGILRRLAPTACSAGSFNTEVGLPLTVLSADESTAFLVLEMGMRGEGHIAYLVDLVDPDVGVVLNVGTAHVEKLGSQEAIARAKGELVRGLGADSLAILNGDDPRVSAMAGTTRARVITFGEGPHNDVRAEGVQLDSLARPSFTLIDVRSGDAAGVDLRLSGRHFVANALAAASVALAVGATVTDVARALSELDLESRWRMEIAESPRGFTVVNDAYNANPESMAAALATLAAMANGRRTWAVLGEMRELGAVSQQEHEGIGRLVASLGITCLVCVGEGAEAIGSAASSDRSWDDECAQVPDVDAAITLLQGRVRPGDLVLVKASRSVGLERVAEALLQREVAA